MYLIGDLPNHIIVFEYGQRLTQKRKERAAELLLAFTKEYYSIPTEHQTFKRALQTIESYRFGKYRQFKPTETGYKTESSGSVNSKPLEIFNIK